MADTARDLEASGPPAGIESSPHPKAQVSIGASSDSVAAVNASSSDLSQTSETSAKARTSHTRGVKRRRPQRRGKGSDDEDADASGPEEIIEVPDDDMDTGGYTEPYSIRSVSGMLIFGSNIDRKFLPRGQVQKS